MYLVSECADALLVVHVDALGRSAADRRSPADGAVVDDLQPRQLDDMLQARTDAENMSTTFSYLQLIIQDIQIVTSNLL